MKVSTPSGLMYQLSVAFPESPPHAANPVSAMTVAAAAATARRARRDGWFPVI
jgi:hypothetical protein